LIISNSASISDFRCVVGMLLFVTMELTMIDVDSNTTDDKYDVNRRQCHGAAGAFVMLAVIIIGGRSVDWRPELVRHRHAAMIFGQLSQSRARLDLSP
jgi:hypothetical protein